MTESKFTHELMADLRGLTGGHVLKHCDRFTGGIPDLSVTVHGLTTWIEVKVDEYKPTKLQLWNIRQLQQAIVVTWKGTKRQGRGYVMNASGIEFCVGDYHGLLDFLKIYCTKGVRN